MDQSDAVKLLKEKPMKYVLVLAVMATMGCSRPRTHWQHIDEFVETFDQCIRDSDGRLIIETMHGTQQPSSPWGVYENGYGKGEYATEENARNAAIARHPECAVK